MKLVYAVLLSSLYFSFIPVNIEAQYKPSLFVKSSYIHYLLAKYYVSKHNQAKALVHINKAMSLGYVSESAYVLKMEILLYLFKTDETIKFCDITIVKFQGTKSIALYKAYIYKALIVLSLDERKVSCYGLFDKAIKLRPKQSDAYVCAAFFCRDRARGYLFRKDKKLYIQWQKRARKYLLEGFKQGVDSFGLLFYLIIVNTRIYSVEKDKTCLFDALRFSNLAIKKYPKKTRLYYWKAYVCILLKDYHQANLTLEKGIKSDKFKKRAERKKKLKEEIMKLLKK